MTTTHRPFLSARRPLDVLLLSLALSLACRPTARAQTVQASFAAPSWNLSKAVGAKVVQHKGRESLYVERGAALLEGVDFGSGVIEVDISAPSARAFAGLRFRSQSAKESEEVYLRLHKSGSPDAVQYAPVYRGAAAWQLHGPGFSNFRYAPGPALAPAPPKAESISGALTRWELAPAFRIDERPLEVPPPPGLTWIPASGDAKGLLSISKYRDPLFQGTVGYNDSLFLSLRKGENELVSAVADAFGGWGIVARLEEPRASAS